MSGTDWFETRALAGQGVMMVDVRVVVRDTLFYCFIDTILSK
jgi:hypothetical protein